MLAFVPGIALQVPAVAAGPRSGARRRRRRRLRPARPLSCTLGLCPGLQLRAGLPLRSGQTPTAQPPPSYQAGPHRCALRLPSLSAASHRQTAASSDLVSPGRYLSRPQPLDSDSSSSPPPPAPPPPPPPARGRPASHLQRDPFLPTPRDTFYSSQMAARSRGCPAAKSCHSLSPVDLLVSPSIQFSSEFAAVSPMCAFRPTP